MQQRNETDIIGEIYRRKIKCDDNPQKREQIKRIIKDVIWPLQKFTDKVTIEEIDLEEEGSFLDIILSELNEEDMGKVDKVKFWMRYGNMISDILNSDKATASLCLKHSVLKGTIIFVIYLLLIKHV